MIRLPSILLLRFWGSTRPTGVTANERTGNEGKNIRDGRSGGSIRAIRTGRAWVSVDARWTGPVDDVGQRTAGR